MAPSFRILQLVLVYFVPPGMPTSDTKKFHFCRFSIQNPVKFNTLNIYCAQSICLIYIQMIVVGPPRKRKMGPINALPYIETLQDDLGR